VIDSDPATPEKLAEITTLPLVRLVTSPVDETVATLVSEDVHAALGVTSATAPLVSVSVAVNCVDDPTAGAVPVTVIDEDGGRRGRGRAAARRGGQADGEGTEQHNERFDSHDDSLSRRGAGRRRHYKE
jgi:hypothetical protein